MGGELGEIEDTYATPRGLSTYPLGTNPTPPSPPPGPSPSPFRYQAAEKEIDKCDVLYAEIFNVGTHVRRGAEADLHREKMQEAKDKAQGESV